jgi:hypothetical protein
MKPPEAVRRLLSEEDAAALQDAIHDWIDDVRDCPLLMGQRIDGITLGAGAATNVAHGLGRVPEGWVVVDKDAAVSVYRDGTATAAVLPLRASGATDVDVWIF